jgi:hypothetical protein
MNASQGKLPATKADVEKAIDRAFDKLGGMVGRGFAGSDKRLYAIEVRLGNIENLLMEEQKRDMEELKKRVKRLEDAIAV